MAKSKYFISFQQIRNVVQYYGGFRKYMLLDDEHQEYGIVRLNEKKNHCLWMTIREENESNDIQVTFTDETGFIVKRHFWNMNDKKLVKCDLEKLYVNKK
jgi:phage anti-repressor protein